jgi:hypothetical protein
VAPVHGKPAVFDDATYFIAFDQPEDAIIAQSLLEWSGAADLLGALIFTDSKRPITKRVLQQLDMGALLDVCPSEAVQGRAQEITSDIGTEPASLDAAGHRLRSTWSHEARTGLSFLRLIQD